MTDKKRLVLTKHAEERMKMRFPCIDVGSAWQASTKMTNAQLRMIDISKKTVRASGAEYFIFDDYIVFVGRFYAGYFLAFTLLKYDDKSFYKAKNLRVRNKKR